MTTTINNEHKKLNVPNLRFPEFQGEWEKYELGDICDIITDFVAAGSFASLRENVKYYQENNYAQLIRTIDLKNNFTNGDFVYVDEVAYDFLWRVQLKEPNIVLPNIGANIGEKYYVKPQDLPKNKNVLGPNAILLRSKCNDTHFVYFRLSTSSYDNEMKKLVGASGQPKFNKTDLKKVSLFMPSLIEQKRIAYFLALLEERIATQNKIIEKLQSLIKGIAQHCIKESTSGNTYVKLGDICQITTGKLDANAQVDNGIYPFFTCAEQPFKIDSFAFDTEALLISGNGANLGYINYYKGKFNAYQRTYVLDLFSENIQYIKWALKVLLPKRIAIEKSSSNTPYIVLSTLTDLRLPIPCKSKQSFIANLMQSLERKLSNQIAQYDSYNYLKQYLLRQMFI